MSRREELESILFQKNGNQRVVAEKHLEEVIFLEEQMEELKKIFDRKSKNDLSGKRKLAAWKQYKEALQQYNSSLWNLQRITGNAEGFEEDSPLRKWAKSREEKDL